MALKITRDSKKKFGMSPGILLHVGEKKVEDIEITHYESDEQQLNM